MFREEEDDERGAKARKGVAGAKPYVATAERITTVEVKSFMMHKIFLVKYEKVN
jgi:hypothetical protein